MFQKKKKTEFQACEFAKAKMMSSDCYRQEKEFPHLPLPQFVTSPAQIVTSTRVEAEAESV